MRVHWLNGWLVVVLVVLVLAVVFGGGGVVGGAVVAIISLVPIVVGRAGASVSSSIGKVRATLHGKRRNVCSGKDALSHRRVLTGQRLSEERGSIICRR